MNEAYRNYLIEMWKEAERTGIKCGITDNSTIGIFFDKIVQPYHYWSK